MLLFLRVSILVVLLLDPRSSFAWGTYGHQQINHAAIELLSTLSPRSRPLAQCLNQAQTHVLRAAVTPDIDWKIMPDAVNHLITLEAAVQLQRAPGDAKSIRRIENFLKTDQQRRPTKRVVPAGVVAGLQQRPMAPAALARLAQSVAQATGFTDPNAALAQLLRKRDITNFEQPLHFFEADAFATQTTRDSIGGLPSHPEYVQSFESYRSLVAANAERIGRIDPSRKFKPGAAPTTRQVIGFGTAPWRALQIYSLSVEALKAGDLATAVTLLGVLGHYVGDLTQPFHATIDFDGKASPRPARGIHAVFETGVPEMLARGAGASRDLGTQLWSGFAGTEPAVLAFARQLAAQTGGVAPLARDRIVAELMRDVAETFQWMQPLTARFAEALTRPPGPGGEEEVATDSEESGEDSQTIEEPAPSEPQAPKRGGKARVRNSAIRAFLSAQVARADQPRSVMQTHQVAELQLGMAALSVARLWASALAESQARLPADCRGFTFNEARSIQIFPFPLYYPNDPALKLPRPAAATVSPQSRPL